MWAVLTENFHALWLRADWDVSGVEISEASLRITEFPVFTEEFNEIPVHAPAYDAITAWAVLEHVHDPMAYFQKASQVLKKGGLFVFQMPNFVSTASRCLFWEDVPRQLVLLHERNRCTYLEKTGLVLEQEDNRGNVYRSSPASWLPYMVRTRLQRKSFTYKDKPLSSKEFRKVHHLQRGITAGLKYLAYSPASVVDRMLWPAPPKPSKFFAKPMEAAPMWPASRNDWRCLQTGLVMPNPLG